MQDRRMPSKGTQNLTIDFKQLMGLTVQDRISFFRYGGASYFEGLTPTQLAQLFPKYYLQQLPDMGRALSGGGGGGGGGGRARVGGGGVGGGGTPTAVPSTGTGTAAPPTAEPSGAAPAPTSKTTPNKGPSKEGAEDLFLSHLNQLTAKKTEDVAKKTTASSGSNFSARLSAYSPQKGGSSMEGGYESSRKGPDGKNVVRTLADYAAGRSSHITLAGNPKYYGKTFIIPEITFIDKSGTQRTLTNVRAVVHDTGGAFKSAGPDRFDMPVDQDASNSIMQQNHTLWSKQGVKFVPQEEGQPQQAQKAGQPGQTTEAPTQQFASEKEKQQYYASVYQRAAKIGKIEGNNGFASMNDFRSQCGRGVRGMAGALLNDEHFNSGLGTTGSANAGSLAINNNYLQESKLYNNRQPITKEQAMSKEYLDSLPVGTVIASHNNGAGPGHVQIKVAPGQFVSDTRQGNRVLEKGSGGAFTGYAVFTPNQAGLNKLDPRVASDPATVAWAQSQGYTLTERQQKVLQNTPSVSKEVVVKPADYDSWNPELKSYVEKLPESVQQKFYQKAKELKEGDPPGDINTAYNDWRSKQGVNATEAAKGVVSAVNTTEPAQLVKYGVGVVNGQKIDPQEIKNRDYRSAGKVSFAVPGMEHVSFDAASGGNAASIMQGTYSVSSQPTGSKIANYYQRYGLTTKGNFGKVFNVDQPGSPTVAGYDPKAQYTRTQIQFHAFPIKDQLDKMKSSGCIVMPPEQYTKFVDAMNQAEKTVGVGNLGLEVSRNRDGQWSYKIIPRTQVRENSAITPEEAAKRTAKTGDVTTENKPKPQGVDLSAVPVDTSAGISQPRFFMNQSGYTNDQLKKIAQTNPGSTIMIDPNWDENKQKQMRGTMEKLGLKEQTYYEGRGGPTGSGPNAKWDPEEYKRIDKQRQDYNKKMGTNYDMTDWRENGKYLEYEHERILNADKIGKKYEIDNMKYSDLQTHMNWRREHNIRSKIMPKNLSEEELNQFKKDNPDWKDHVPGYSFHEHGTYEDKKQIEKLWEGQVKPYFDPNAAATFNYRTPSQGIPDIRNPQTAAPAPAAAAPVTTPSPAPAPAPTQQAAPPMAPTQYTPVSNENSFGDEPTPTPNKTGGNYQTTRENRAVVNLETGKTELTFQGGPGGEDFSMQDGRLEITPRSRTNPDSLRQPEMPSEPQAQQTEPQQQATTPRVDNSAGMLSGMKPERSAPMTLPPQNNFSDRLESPLKFPPGAKRAYEVSTSFTESMGDNTMAIRNGYDTIIS